jgi:phenylacetate-coenzyme A ligase PaaK-like adenylate-forming protein
MNASEFARELESRLNSQRAAALLPLDLANLFRQTFQPGDHQKALLHVLQKYLLWRTVQHAHAQTVFYSDDVYATVPDSAPEDLPDLSAWPIIDRHDVNKRYADFIARDVVFESASHTSGSTGASLQLYKSREELAFIWSYYFEIMKPAFAGITSLPLSLFFPNLYHGVSMRLPSFGKVFVSGVTDDSLIQDALKVLQRTYDIPGHDSKISIISGLSFHIKFFTNFLLEQGYNPRDFGVRSISIVGEYVSRLSRKFLIESWDAIVIERFTLTESVAGATRCLQCDHFHLDPHGIGEIINPDTQKNIEEGIGYLVLTQLYPFVQMHPLIRYYTGDLVRKVESSCCNTLTFDFCGKTSNCIRWKVDGKTEWLLFSVDLFEIINELPDVRLYNTWPNVRIVKDTTVSSPPIFTQETRSDSGRFAIVLTLELRYSPHFFQERVEQLQNKIRSHLVSVNAKLRQRLEEGVVTLDIRFVGPGSLSDTHKIKI